MTAATLGKIGLGMGIWGGLGCLFVGAAAFLAIFLVSDYFNKVWH